MVGGPVCSMRLNISIPNDESEELHKSAKQSTFSNPYDVPRTIQMQVISSAVGD
jgi:hypothetical protein